MNSLLIPSILLIAFISVALSVLSLRNMKKIHEVNQAKRSLQKGRIVFYSETETPEKSDDWDNRY